MGDSERLRLEDIRAAFRLLGECCELGQDAEAWRRHMLNGLLGLTGAQVALYLQLRAPATPREQLLEPLDAGFLDASQRELWAHYQRENAQRDDPFHLRYYRDFSGTLRTRSLRSVVDRSVWQRSRHYNEYVRACGLDDRLTSSLRLPGNSDSTLQVLVLHRSAADGQYSGRARRLLHVFHDELQLKLGRQLLVPGAPHPGESLPPQLRQVLALLLQGDAEKQIAARLGLSRHTVNRHVQRLYRRFDVHSRAELTFRCRGVLR